MVEQTYKSVEHSSESDAQTFGTALAQLRLQTGFTQRALARKMGHSTGSQTNWERNKCMPSLEVVREFDELLGGRGGLEALWTEQKGAAGVPAHLRDDVALLGRSQSVELVTPALVPGLLQHPDYARYILVRGRPTDSLSQIEERVTARCRVLDSEGKDVRVSAIFPRTALDVVPPDIARSQAAHLVNLVDTGRVTIYLVHGEGLVGVAAPFSLYRLRGVRDGAQDGAQAATTDHAVGSVVVGPADVALLRDLARSALAESDSSALSLQFLKEKAT